MLTAIQIVLAAMALSSGAASATANGEEVIVRDRQDQTFVFRANGAGPSLGNQLADLRGSLHTGRRVKTLDGFGRNRT